MKIKGTTRITGIFGDPIGHTLSPVMQNAAFEALGLDLVYLAFHVTPPELDRAVESIRVLKMAGVNVTIPHKESIIKLLDEVDEEAQEIGAVNTVVNREGRLKGYNTDSKGYLMSLKRDTGFSPAGKSAVVLGAGGASRAVSLGLLKNGARRLVIVNRTLERASSLAKEFKGRFEGVDIEAVELVGDAVGPYLEDADLLVNTTSMGMEGGPALTEELVPLKRLKSGAIVSDIVYRPLDTDLIRRAQKEGFMVHKGLGMLVCQGALSFELWTGRKAPVEVMEKACMEELAGG